jgi:hypothetical protein
MHVDKLTIITDAIEVVLEVFLINVIFGGK